MANPTECHCRSPSLCASARTSRKTTTTKTTARDRDLEQEKTPAQCVPLFVACSVGKYVHKKEWGGRRRTTTTSTSTTTTFVPPRRKRHGNGRIRASSFSHSNPLHSPLSYCRTLVFLSSHLPKRSHSRRRICMLVSIRVRCVCTFTATSFCSLSLPPPSFPLPPDCKGSSYYNDCV